ncbi:hypothetical protein TbgDal_X15120 [Trypanosoma brucei gambiense DAL972]|uniref:Uncharacterized protein n=1 Tax=Trypanosoma brucei gambiense (strain MHOM/CI/86/DAL972) TaxID=679716 RepID=D0A569_TRYB9|nr:hypothetical protein TbgDal_X15120 [Trypanosoma brucei gambiense DAL972]CBH16413.1 hypothetical protein TbgDal_X15120 [Trypanosoma brucei gambiense DAL972]|eukprot:XP_011778677.1 hypothetical protein TbgDal_X15120 [Trypanosoma brucei gambiense DAL972]
MATRPGFSVATDYPYLFPGLCGCGGRTGLAAAGGAFAGSSVNGCAFRVLFILFPFALPIPAGVRVDELQQPPPLPVQTGARFCAFSRSGCLAFPNPGARLLNWMKDCQVPAGSLRMRVLLSFGMPSAPRYGTQGATPGFYSAADWRRGGGGLNVQEELTCACPCGGPPLRVYSF